MVEISALFKALFGERCEIRRQLKSFGQFVGRVLKTNQSRTTLMQLFNKIGDCSNF